LSIATEAAELAIHDYDPITGAIQWDSRLRKIWGVGEDEPISVDTFLSGIHPEDRERIEAELRRAVDPNGPGKFAQEYRIINRIDHKQHWIYATGQTTIQDGKALRLAGTVEDITSRKEIENALTASEQKFRELVQSVNGVIVRWNNEGKITFINEYGLRFFGYTEEQLIGKPAVILLPRRDSDGRDLTTLADDIIESPTRYASNLNENVKADGSRVWMAWTNRPLYDENGRLKEILGVGTDLTEIRRMEQALHEYTRKLEESNAELERFAYVASHDLQEPLRKIKAFGERLTLSAGGQLDPDSLEFLDRIKNASQRMQIMIDGLLQLSRVTTKGLPFVNVDLHNTAEAVLDDLQLRIETSGGKVDLEGLPEIQADPIQMHQLLLNLIGNGLKFHEKGKAPFVEVYSKMIDNTDLGEKNELKIYVKDNGIGFDEQHLDRIFRPLERLVGRSQYEGSGMGLAICKKIVERHGGTITAKSKPGVGSTFIVTLPQKQ
jgi:PAS domain S-box-containing protein